jgi:hypothetical protein
MGATFSDTLSTKLEEGCGAAGSCSTSESESKACKACAAKHRLNREDASHGLMW